MADPVDALDFAPLLQRFACYARPSQIIEPTRPIVNLRAGRSYGKTRTGAEHCLSLMERWGSKFRGLAASRNDEDTTNTLVTGPAGLAMCAEARGYSLDYSPSRGTVTHPSGAVLQLGSGQNRELGRSQNLNFAWLDELYWYEHAEAAFACVRFALRLNAPAPGRHILITSTPSHLCKLKLNDAEVVQTIRGSTHDNSMHLAPAYLREIERAYAGSPLGRQEILADDIEFEHALVSLARMHETRVAFEEAPFEYQSIVVGVDPGGFATKDPLKADATGLCVMGLTVDDEGEPDLYILHSEAFVGDAEQWAPRAIELANHYDAGRIVIEVNQGGAMVLEVVRRHAGPAKHRLVVEPVVASASKLDRALPLQQQFNLGRAHLVGTNHSQLETELASWAPKSGRASPNVLDCAAHSANALLPEGGVGSTGIVNIDANAMLRLTHTLGSRRY